MATSNTTVASSTAVVPADTAILPSETAVVEAETSNATFGNITVTLTKNEPPGFSPTVREIREAAEYELRGKESGMINENSGASAVIRQNGQINLSSTKYASYKLNPTGKSIEYTLESVAITNRRKILCNDFIINEHKMNPKLYDLTDFKELELPTNESVIVGNFCVYGSVLTKSWDADLKRYMLIRRPARMPMFSPLLNVPDIHQGLGIEDPLKIDPDILGITEAGYHVNMVISDAGSLIGKEGFDRPGIDRMVDQAVEGLVSGSNTSTTSSTTGSGTSSDGNYDTEVVSTPVPSDIMKAELANKIAEGIKVRPRLLWAHMAYESSDKTEGKFKSNLAKTSNNYGGVKVTKTDGSQKISTVKPPASEGGNPYRHFDSDEEYIKYAGDPNGLYKSLLSKHKLGEAKTIRQWVTKLKERGYFQSSENDYMGGMLRYVKEIPNSFVSTDGGSGGTSVNSDKPQFKGFNEAVQKLSGVSLSVACMFPDKGTDIYLYNNRSCPSASLIKVFIAEQAYKANKGTSYVKPMIEKSHNESTNAIIRAFGLSELNKLINAAWPNTKLQREMLASGPDNYTTVEELVKWFYKLYKGEFQGNSTILQYCKNQEDNVPVEVLNGKGISTAHKTGWHPDNKMGGDAGIAYGTSNGVMIYAIIGIWGSVQDVDTALRKLGSFWTDIIKKG